MAVRFLEMAETVNRRALHVPEAIWLKANCEFALGNYRQAMSDFLRVRDEFTAARYLQRVKAKIEECQARLAAAPPAR
jgi:hypothetical protein